MKNKIFIVFLVLILTACTSTQKKYKKEFAKAVEKEN